MKNAIPFLLGMLWLMPAQAAPVLPGHIAGSWGTADSLYAGDTEQVQLFLEADGLGMLAGSGKPPINKDGSKIAGIAPRPIMAMPVRAVLNEDVLTLQPFLLGKAEAEKAKKLTFACRLEAAGPTLQCLGPDGKAFALKRLGDTVVAENAKQIGVIRDHAAAHPHQQ